MAARLPLADASSDAALAGLIAALPEGQRRQVAADLRSLTARMAMTGHRRDEPMREVLARLGDRWSPLLLMLLRIAPLRHGTLRRMVGAVSAEGRISQRMLTLRLRSLERDGFVRRRDVAGKILHVEYSLTPFGRALVARLDVLTQWIDDNSAAIAASRAAFDAAGGRDGG